VRCDEGATELVVAISNIPGVTPLFSCQGHAGDIELGSDSSRRKLLSAYVLWAETETDFPFARRLGLELANGTPDDLTFSISVNHGRWNGKLQAEAHLYFTPSGMPQIVDAIRNLAHKRVLVDTDLCLTKPTAS
jgi:hypothetical protein